MNVFKSMTPLPYSEFNLSNPNKTKSSFLGTIGYLVLGTISIPFVWLAGAKGVVSYIWNRKQQLILENKKKIIQSQITTLQGRIQPKSTSKNNFRKNNREINRIIKNAKKQIEVLDFTINKNRQNFIASLLALTPVLGVPAVGAYLLSKSTNIQETGIRGGVEAMAQKIFEGRGSFVRSIFYALQGKPLSEFRKYLPAYLLNKIENPQGTGLKNIKIPVKIGINQHRELHAITIPARSSAERQEPQFDPLKPTVVVFHGNGETAHCKLEHANFYQHLGFNAVLVTMGGYPGSGLGVKTSEVTSYQDADATIKYLKNLGVNNIVVHGTSLGGTLAFAAGELHSDVVKLVVADQTFDKPANVAVNLLNNITGNYARFVPSALIRGLVAGSFTTGEIVPGVAMKDGSPYRTDGLNNLRKASVLRRGVFAIKAERDHFMGREGSIRDGFKENFADDLILARYKSLVKNSRKSHSMAVLPKFGHNSEVGGEHCSWFNHYTRLQPANRLFNDHGSLAYRQSKPLQDKLKKIFSV
ncbi:MAG: hypothetical protein H0W88_04860 [Parachlamydiaceae bacterium]|nr:hypothetical protein [Parachlamydiaceae bacterium]